MSFPYLYSSTDWIKLKKQNNQLEQAIWIIQHKTKFEHAKKQFIYEGLIYIFKLNSNY